MLEITQHEQDGVLNILLTGELDQHSAATAIDHTEDLLALYPAEKLCLRLGGLSFMDSAGLALVLNLHRICARSGLGFAICDTPPQPLRVFEAAGLTHVMQFETEEAPCAK